MWSRAVPVSIAMNIPIRLVALAFALLVGLLAWWAFKDKAD